MPRPSEVPYERQLPMTDVLLLFKHSEHQDEELRYALRGIAQYARFVRKVWIFGDRPPFLAPDRQIIEQVPHEYLTRLGGFRAPLRNTFLMTFLGSLLPELSSEFVFFCDDFILLQPLERADLTIQRYIEDMSEVSQRGRGLFRDALWRTHDILKHLGYSLLNFENHVPTLFTKKQVLEAYLDLEDYVTQDRFAGLLTQTSILNHARKTQPFPVVHLASEAKHIGFHHREFSFEDIALHCYGKTFLNFDDKAFNAAMKLYLRERFPMPCKFEA